MYKKSICRIGLVQTTSNDLLESNIEQCGQYVEELAGQGASIAFLPENAFFMRREARSKEDPVVRLPKYPTVENPGVLAAQAWAKTHKLWIVIGSIAPKESDTQALPYNRSVVIDDTGKIAAHYDKIHLFDVTLDGGESYLESARISAGKELKLVDTPWGKLGLSICYDIRFAKLYRQLAQAGAVMMSIPAAFTVPTGKAHWEVLLRARAIETGSFVIAAAQCGEHPGGRKSYGHSMVVGPWGEVLCDLDEAPGTKLVEIDLSDVQKARNTIPAWHYEREWK